MKKIFLIVQGKDASSALTQLRDLGTVHVEHQKLPEGQKISVLKDEVAKLKILVEYLKKLPLQPQQELEAAQEKADTLTRLLHKLNQLKDETVKRQALIN
ncbi:MAG: hypothetical protein WCX16_04095, partial [Candidatus Omnitrophota bacterium]